jgi:hypothetical protein
MADPFAKQSKDLTEGLAQVKEAAALQFIGGVDISKEPALLPLGSFSAIVNMRPMRPGFQTRRGCIRLHTVPDTA